MEQKRNIILHGAEQFSRGALDNVALQDGAIILDDVAGQHVLYGCYTSPEFTVTPFSSLNMSWNADTPEGTVVEAQCRVWTGGDWSGWKSFGKWSPDYPRRSICVSSADGEDSKVFICGDTVAVTAAEGATALQMRIFLYTDDERQTPCVRLLAASVCPLQWNKQAGKLLNRMLYLPEYSMTGHEPRFGITMDLPLILTALMNRYGEDVLPEEVAHVMADGATEDCRNAAYAAAAAGCMGYECYQAWMDLRELRAEIRQGYAVAVELKGTNTKTSGTAWMGLRGFGYDESVHANYIQLNDPFALRGAVSRTMAVEDFDTYFTGRALVLHRGPRGVHGCRPLRRTCSLKPGQEPGTWDFDFRGDPLPLPEPFTGWLAAATKDGPASPTTAERTFLPIEKTPGGGIRLPDELRKPGARYTIFAVDATGSMWVAELQLPNQQSVLTVNKEIPVEGESPAVQDGKE